LPAEPRSTPRPYSTRFRSILEGLHSANGITLSNDEQAVIVAETDGYRLNRLWIQGRNAGKREILAANLPGFPDNVSRLQNNTFRSEEHTSELQSRANVVCR